MLQLHPKKRSKYRNYDPTSLQKAFKEWQDGKLSVYKAAKLYGVPEQTLRDRATGVIKPTVNRSGPASLLSAEEEQDLCDHVKKMALFGYGYSYMELRLLATDTAVFSGKLPNNSKLLSEMWLVRFLKRHPDLKGLKPRSLSLVRAKAVSAETVAAYYQELNTVLQQYDLLTKPHRIFNIDETGITPEHKPPYVIGPKGMSIPAITSSRSETTTIIACCSATGQSVPPYFVFKGKRLNEDLLQGALPGTGACMSDKGWSNSSVFFQYISEHLSKHIPGGIGSDYTLILYDGASSHFSPLLINWALANKVVLMVLPAHSSHCLQPLDVGVFKPFKCAYNRACQEFLRANVGRQITRYDICSLACKAYTKALTPANIMNAFRKTGVVPFNSHVLSPEQFLPNEITCDQTNASSANLEVSENETIDSVSTFLKKKVPKFVPPIKRKFSSKLQTSGKEITNLQIAESLVKKSVSSATKKCKKFKVPVKDMPDEQIPGPSGVKTTVNVTNSPDSLYDSDIEDTDQDSDKCCVCRKFYVDRQDNDFISIISWGQCDMTECNHWVHLKYCTPVRVLRRHDKFFCPCHSNV